MSRRDLFFVGALLTAFALVLVFVPRARANAGVALEVAKQAPSVGPGGVASWTVSCLDSATLIVPSTADWAQNVLAFECSAPESTETDAATLIAIGGSDIADPTFATRNSPVICGSGCAQTSKNVNGRQAYCRADDATDPAPLFCWAIVATSTAP